MSRAGGSRQNSLLLFLRFSSDLEGLFPRLAEDLLEGMPEVPVEDGVDSWV